MDIIFEREIPEKRRREISGIAKKTSQQFINNLRGAHIEDDLVELVYKALRMMHKDETLDFPRKAGTVLPLTPMYTSLRANLDLDWDPSLKPDVQQEVWDLDALGQPNNEADDVVDRPNKRQQREDPSPLRIHHSRLCRLLQLHSSLNRTPSKLLVRILQLVFVTPRYLTH